MPRSQDNNGRHFQDPAFWAEYRDAGPPVILDTWQRRFFRAHDSLGQTEAGFYLELIFDAALLGSALLIGGFIAWRVRAYRRRQEKSAPPAN